MVSSTTYVLTEYKLCGSERIADFQALIDETINEDITYQRYVLSEF